MPPTDLRRHRLFHQHLAETTFTKPEQIVSHLGAMQSQEWAMAKWAIGLRIPGLTDADVEAAYNAGAILRTHVLRPTWHFVSPADIRWMLALSGPRVQAGNALMYRKTELDNVLFRRCHVVFTRALEGGKHLTRPALQAALAGAGIQAEGQRLGYVMMQAELEGLVCSGPRQGKQFTYALLDERVPPTPALSREESLAALCLRYFGSRGPATLANFTWWSGLTMKDARAGVATSPAPFVRETFDGQEHFFVPTEACLTPAHQTTFLLPDYDEYGISYKNRSALFVGGPPVSAGNGTYPHTLVVEGVAAGSWKCVLNRKDVAVKPSAPLTEAQQRAVQTATDQYLFFVGNAPNR